jgi:hypothetical protein
MRLRALPFALLALAFAVAGSADAQPKKKKPKKPKSEQTREKDTDDEPAPSSNADPPKIDTNLREEDTPPASSNPWFASGESKKKGDDSGSSSGWDHALDRKKKSEDEWKSRPIALAAVAGYASANLRIGMSIRAGYSISDRFYVGGAFMYHLGTAFGETTIGGYYPAAELGYDYHVQGFTIRPYAGVGVFFTRVTGATADIEVNDDTALAFYPGVQFDYQFGAGFVGVDARLLFIFASDRDASLGFFAVGGVRF